MFPSLPLRPLIPLVSMKRQSHAIKLWQMKTLNDKLPRQQCGTSASGLCFLTASQLLDMLTCTQTRSHTLLMLRKHQGFSCGGRLCFTIQSLVFRLYIFRTPTFCLLLFRVSCEGHYFTFFTHSLYFSHPAFVVPSLTNTHAYKEESHTSSSV